MKIDWVDFFDAFLLAIGLLSMFVPIIMMTCYEGNPFWMFCWFVSAVTISLCFGRKKGK